jgi:RNA polymerase sigma-70 factor (ECF subfamily)
MQQQSFTDFYAAQKDQCFRALLVTVKTRHEAEDLLAESFTRALANWATIQDHPAPQAWVVRTALNLHRDRWRKLATAHKYRSSSQDISVDRHEFVDPKLLKAIHELPEKQKSVVAYRVILDLSLEQTAIEMGIARGTVAAHLNRALTTLKTTLNQTIWIQE